VKSGSSRRLDRARWVDAALEAIETGGPDAVAVVRVARDLGVTKGSFYWHFADRRELLRAALDAWFERYTTEPEERFGAIRDPRERLRSLFSYATLELEPTVIVELLAHLDDPDIATTVKQATERRIELLTRAYRELGLPPARARDQALLAYSTFLGFAQLRQDPSEALATDRQTRRLLERALEALVDLPAPSR
jgi:AcrR family transcriptional regulator